MTYSQEYYDAIAEGALHHAETKTYSGSFLRPHKPFLSEMISRLDCGSALDVGAGKGVQYEWIDPEDGKTLEQAWGFAVRKYDPCWPPFADRPSEKFDLVICTHVASLIPQRDLAEFIGELFSFAKKGVFIAEKIGERKKAEVADPNSRAIDRDAYWWVSYLDQMIPDGCPLEIVLSVREILPRGRITTRYIWRDGFLVESIEAQPRG